MHTNSTGKSSYQDQMEIRPKELKFAVEIDTNFCVAKTIFPHTSPVQHALTKAEVACDAADVHCV
jgi:hypothetical protein